MWIHSLPECGTPVLPGILEVSMSEDAGRADRGETVTMGTGSWESSTSLGSTFIWKLRVLPFGRGHDVEKSRVLQNYCFGGKWYMAPHSSTLAWKIPWTEEPGRLQSMGSLRVRHYWVTSLSLFTFMHWRRKWQPTPVFLPGECQGWGSLVGCHLWGRTELDTTEVP